MIIDAHQHVNWLGHAADRVIANMDQHGIYQSWLLTWEGPPSERDLFAYRVSDPCRENMPLCDVVEACRRYPNRFIPGYAPDPRDYRALSRLESAVELYQIRVYGEWKFQILLDSPECTVIFRLCGKLKLPVVLHLDVPFLPPNDLNKYYKLWYGGTLENLERALRICPETIFAGHGPGFWRYLSGDGETHPDIYPTGEFVPGGKLAPLMRRCPNLYADLSANSAHKALSRNENFAREFIDEFQNRLLFGRDLFDSMMYDFLISLNLPPAVLDKILYRNALNLVG